MVAGVRLRANRLIDSRGDETLGKRWTQKEMVETQSCVSLEALPHVVPKRIDARVRTLRA